MCAEKSGESGLSRGRAHASEIVRDAEVSVRHNVVALGADLALFLVGLSFASQSTILPAFAAHLGAPNIAIAAIPALMTLGWFVPALFLAGHTASLPHRLPFVLRYTVWERAPFLVIALAAFFLAPSAPGLTLAVLLLALIVITGTGGALLPAWMDIVGRTVPVALRGRFFAGANIVASVGGLLGGFATAYLLATVPAPASYGICFLLAAAFTGVSYVALALVREPAAAETAPAVALRAYLRTIPDVLRGDRNLVWFLVARAVAVAGTLASGFFTIYALKAFAAPDWWVGVFTTALMAGQIAGNVVLGWLADRAGHLPVLICATVAMLAANAAALGAVSLPVFTAVFILAGIHQAGLEVSSMNVLLEFAPSVAARPTYLGLARTAVGPVAFATPLVAGVLVDVVGFRPIFALGSALGALAVVLLVTKVRDPRRDHVDARS
jgi:MFS family permease